MYFPGIDNVGYGIAQAFAIQRYRDRKAARTPAEVFLDELKDASRLTLEAAEIEQDEKDWEQIRVVKVTS